MPVSKLSFSPLPKLFLLIFFHIIYLFIYFVVRSLICKNMDTVYENKVHSACISFDFFIDLSDDIILMQLLYHI